MSNQEIDRVPPQNLEAEQAVLGSMLIEPSAARKAASLLTPGDFYRELHAQIFDAARAITERSKPLDMITLSDELRLRGQFDESTVFLYLQNLMDAPSSAANVKHYCNLVRDASQKRAVLCRMRELFALVYQPDGLDRMRAMNGHADLGKLVSVSDGDLIPLCLADVTEEYVEYLWRPWLVVGKLHIWSGDPGIFKSGISLDLAARITTGRAMPLRETATSEPGNVLLLVAEDSPGDTIKSRFLAAGGDPARLFCLTPKQLGDISDFATLKRLLKKLKIKLLIIDPLASFIPDAIERRGKVALRQELLAPLTEMAEECKCAIIALAHLNKGSSGGNALYRSSGYLDYVAFARVTVLFTKDPKLENTFLFVCTKSNLDKTPQTIVYKIKQTEREIPYVEYIGVTDEWTGGNVLFEQAESPEKRKGEEECKSWILEYLRDGKEHKATEMERDAKEELGVTAQIYNKVRMELTKAKQIKRSKDGLRGPSCWSLQAQEIQSQMLHETASTALTEFFNDEDEDPYAEDE